MSEGVEIGGAPVVALQRPAPADPGRPGFVRAVIVPGRGMMTLRLVAHLPGRGETDVIAAPPLEEARWFLDGAAGDFPGNASYLVGGAILVPYANRIRGSLSPGGTEIATEALGEVVRLPANAGGKRPGAERYAMHGLLLSSRIDDVRRETSEEADALVGSFRAGDFGGRWLSSTDLSFAHVLASDAYTLTVTATNAGSERLPIGIGWHPYFALPSGRRQQVRLHVPARGRALVNDYDEVLPTGEVVPVAGTPYDVATLGGLELGDLFLDDCFVDLERSAGGEGWEVVSEIVDPAAGYGLRIVAAAPPVTAVQVYAPPEKSFVALEPQLNRADPFGAQWPPGVDTGMVVLAPGESTTYRVRLELFTAAS